MNSLAAVLTELTTSGEFPSSPLHVLPCGNISDTALTSLLRETSCQKGCSVSERCDPCQHQLLESLYKPPGEALLLWAGSSECLQVPESLVPPYWAGSAVVLVPPEGLSCVEALSQAIFTKAPFPLCLKKRGDVYEVWRRITFSTEGIEVRRIARFEDGRLDVTAAGLAASHNLNGVNLRVEFINYYPYVFCPNVLSNRTCVDPLLRPETSIISVLADHLNFTTTLQEHPKRVWGSQLQNGSWHGLLSSVVYDKADLAVGGMSVTYSRANVVDFLREFTVVTSVFVTHRPSPLAAYLTVIAPLSPRSWAVVITAVVLVGAVSALQRGCRLDLAMMEAYTVIVEQSLSRDITALADRLLTGVWFLMAFVIATMYTSNLTSFLINGAPGVPIETMDQLAESNLQLVASQSNKMFLEWLDERQGSTFAALRRKLVTVPKLTTSFQQHAKDHSLAHVFEDAYFEYALSNTVIHSNGTLWPRDIVVSKDTFMPSPLAIPVQKNAPYRRHMDHVILRLIDTGLVKKWLADALFSLNLRAFRANVAACRRNRKDCRNDGEERQSINMQHLQGPMIILVFGHLLAIAVFILELQLKGFQRLGSKLRQWVKRVPRTLQKCFHAPRNGKKVSEKNAVTKDSKIESR
ncbi:glutamate receptor ionotropic, delta-1-like [Amphibalanus amphitrite]|uniref:glutamate receptor ionotropic, delta-1-like n=1 Tax=Amphibalanus amphitrite TaxID=1232801 RepID=UPI001C925623|nr:glutamate receptor ionotropic, delta-1-like [Amphibalanus amphitrite]